MFLFSMWVTVSFLRKVPFQHAQGTILGTELWFYRAVSDQMENICVFLFLFPFS